MRLRDDPAEAAFRAGLRAWLAATVAQAGDPRRWGKLLHDAGYAGLTWPVDVGGAGFDAIYQGIFAEECALADAPEHPNVIGLNMVGPTVIRYGTPAQRTRHLPAILTGDELFCQGFSEPDAGSDLAAVRTAARPHGTGYRITGEKMWSSYAPVADHCLLLARTGPDAGRHDGLTCFLLDMAVPGVTVDPIRMITGENGFGRILLSGAEVPADAVLGEPGDGWRVAMTTLSHERGTFGITLTARLARRFDRLLATVRATGRDGDPVVRQTVAELYVELDALRQTGYRALSTLVRTGAPGPESSLLKLHWSETNQRLAAFAFQLCAGTDVPELEAFWLHERLRSRGNTLEGGTSEVLRGVIAQRVCGLPRAR